MHLYSYQHDDRGYLFWCRNITEKNWHLHLLLEIKIWWWVKAKDFFFFFLVIDSNDSKDVILLNWVSHSYHSDEKRNIKWNRDYNFSEKIKSLKFQEKIKVKLECCFLWIQFTWFLFSLRKTNIDCNESALYRPYKDSCGFDYRVGVQLFFYILF